MAIVPDIDPNQQRKLIPALQRAIEKTFTEGDWKHLGYETGTDDYINRHPRLLRSLQWGDSDYGGCIFDALEVIASRGSANLSKVLGNDKVQGWLKDHQPDIYGEFIGMSTSVPSARPRVVTPREDLERAIRDAETLIESSGPVSAVDRIHTALHAYLLAACDEKRIAYSADPSVTELYKLLRTNHPNLLELGARSQDIDKVLKAFSSVIDSLNPLRNRGSLAHPTSALLGDDEAMLVINATRTLMHYLGAKL